MLFTVQHKSALLINRTSIESAFELLKTNRKKSFLAHFNKEGLGKQVIFQKGKNIIPYNGQSFYSINYKGDFPDYLTEAFEKMKALNDMNPREQYKIKEKEIKFKINKNLMTMKSFVGDKINNTGDKVIKLTDGIKSISTTIGDVSLFIVAIFIIGKQNYLFDRVFTISTKFYDVSGLQVGNNVRFSGINIGTVEKIIIINDSMVQVDLVILERVQKHIKKDSKIGIGSEGIIGDKILYITQGGFRSLSIKKNQFLFSFEPINTEDILESVEVSALNAEVVTHELSEIMQKINSGKGTLGRLIQDTSIADNLSKTMKNIESSSHGFDQNMEAAKDNFSLRGHFRRKDREALKLKELNEKNKSNPNNSK